MGAVGAQSDRAARDEDGAATREELRARIDELAERGCGPWSSGGAEQLAEAHRVVSSVLDARLGDEARVLHRLGLRVFEEGALARLRAVERVQAATERLAEAGALSQLLERGAAEAAHAADLDRVVLSRVTDGWLVADGVWCREGGGDAASLLVALQADPDRLEYPLVEAELLRRRRAQLVADDTGPSARHAFARVMGWDEYVATPIVLEGRAIGFLHGDRQPARGRVTAVDRDALWRFALAFVGLFERAVLRRRLRIQRQELRQVASWADARTSELSDGAIDLPTDRHALEDGEPLRAPTRESELHDLLTKRERDVLEYMVRGESNAGIARALVVTEGTVKFHVKNILRKLNAGNRAEATSRYLRMSLGGRSHG